MADNEVSMKVGAKAEIAELVAYAAAIRDVNAAMQAHVAVAAAATQAGLGAPVSGAAGGGANTGAPPPTPTPPASSGAHGRPPAPPGGVPGTPTPAAGGPPPPPHQVPGWPPGTHTWGTPVPPGPNTGAPPPTPGTGTPGGAGTPNMAGQWATVTGPPRAPNGQFLPRGGGGGGGFTNPFAGSGSTTAGSVASGFGSMLAAGASRVAGGVGSFVSNVASTTLGVGLGSSLLGLPLTALNRYLQLSQVLTQIDRKFRDSGDSAQWFGRQMGFGIARSGQLAETLGKVTNRIDQESAVGMAGFARFTGADPGLALGTLGRMGTLSGRPTSDIDMARVLVGAKAQGMDQGRLEEFLTRVETSIQTAFEATGRVSLQATMATVGLPSVVYGENDPRRANDTSLVSGLNSTMTGGGAMRSYMMRAMGYGQSGGPSYIAMKKRLDAGVFDPQNVLDLFGSFQSRGMGEGAQFRAIESVAGGQLKAHQIEALVKSLGTREGLDRFRKAAGTDNLDTFDALRSTMSESEYETFTSGGGFKALGRKGISAGESYENQIDARMVRLGGELAQGIPGLMGAMDSLGRTIEKMAGGDIGGKIERASAMLERVALAIEGKGGYRSYGTTLMQEGAGAMAGEMASDAYESVVPDVSSPGESLDVLRGLRMPRAGSGGH